MTRLRSWLTMPEPPPFARQRQCLKRRRRPTVVRHTRPLANRRMLTGRALSDRQRRNAGWNGMRVDILLAVICFLTSLAINTANLEHTSFHPDETRWMNRAYYFPELTEPFGPAWQDYVTTRGQPPLGSIVMGIGLMLQGHDPYATASWDFAYDKDWNTVAGAMPTDADRFAARRTNAVIGAVVTACAFVLGRTLTNRVGGLAAAAYLAWHPLHIVLSTQALSDETLALSLLLIFITGWHFAKKPTWTKAILLGILLGLGGSVKLTPLLLAGPLATLGVLRFLVDRSSAARKYAVMMAAQPFIALATFIASYPYLWPNPASHLLELYKFRAQEMAAQNNAWPGARVTDPLNALARFGWKLTYQHSPSRKLLTGVYDWLNIPGDPTGLDFIPTAAGVVLLTWWVCRKGLWSPQAMVMGLMAAEGAALTLGMKTDFYRYHLPVMMLIAPCLGVGTGVAWDHIHRWISRWRASRHIHTFRTTPRVSQRARHATVAIPREATQ